MTDTPVLLVGFNRPDRMTELIDRLRGVRPAKVYVAVDGPRSDRPSERDLVMSTRDTVSRIDWGCDVRTLFRSDNLGCGRGVSGAISWLFSHEEEGIVLEDDVLPDPTFFPFVSELLARYRHDPRVWAVSGSNPVPAGWIGVDASYRFATVPHIWGWGSWRRNWDHYRYSLQGWRRRLPARSLWRAVHHSPWGFAYWSAMFDLMARTAVDTWDFQFVCAAMTRGALTATSNQNLTENIGIGPESTHTAVAPRHLQAVSPIGFPLRHPTAVGPDLRSDNWSRQNVFGATPTGMGAQAVRYLRRELGSG